MKLNKKGVTLVEVIISVTLIAIVMLFLFKILINIRYEQQYSGFDEANSVNRSEIIRYVQDDFGNLKVKEIYDESAEDSFVLKIKYDNDEIKYLTVKENIVYYGAVDAERKWTLKVNNINTRYIVNCVQYDMERSTDFFMFKIVVRVDDHSPTNSILDDLEFFYMGINNENIKLIEGKDYLGYGDGNNCENIPTND